MITKLMERIKFKNNLKPFKKEFKEILRKNQERDTYEFYVELDNLYIRLREMEEQNSDLLKNDNTLKKSLFNFYYKIDSTKFNSMSIYKNN